jgi:LPXTG-motif cell wall-anchored protein
MLAATAISVPLLLIGAGEAAGSAHRQVGHGAHHVAAARDVRAKRHSRAAHHPKGAAQHPTRAAQHPRRGAPRRHAGAVQLAKRDDPAWRTGTSFPALAAKTTAWRPAEARHAARTARSRSWRLAFAGPRKAHTASDPADTISDFKFTPGTLTVHVGDTVTWTNDGPTDHTATADDGSFNTGTLKKGQSASHTFTKTGTFAYICAIHPFMKGKVVVEASAASTTTPGTTTPTHDGRGNGAGTSGSTSTASGSSSTVDTSSGTAASGPILPQTGLDLIASVLLGLTLLGAGLGLRRRVS